MLGFRRKRLRARRLAALAIEPGGVAFAQVLRPEAGSPVLEACEHHEVASAAQWGAVVGDLARRHRLDSVRCSVLLGSNAYSLLLVESPEVPADELRAAVRWRVRDLIDFHVDDAALDVFDVPPLRGAGRLPMLYVAAARASMISERVALADEAELALEIIDIEELALRNVAAQLAEDAVGVAMLHLGDETGHITLTRDGTLYLARRLEGPSTTMPVLADDAPAVDHPRVREWLDSLVVEVQRSLDYYESNFTQAPIGHLVIGPMSQPVDGMARYFAEQLGLTVRAVDVGAVLECAAVPPPSVQARCFSAVGAALRHEEASL